MSISPLQDAADLIKEGNVTEAIHLLKGLTDVLPGYAAAFVLLGHALEAHQQPQAALAAWQQAALLIPNSRVIQQGLLRTADVLAVPARSPNEPTRIADDATNQNENPPKKDALPSKKAPPKKTTNTIGDLEEIPKTDLVSFSDSSNYTKTKQDNPSDFKESLSLNTDTPWQWPEALIKAPKNQEYSATKAEKVTLEIPLPKETDSQITPTQTPNEDIIQGVDTPDEKQKATDPVRIDHALESQEDTKTKPTISHTDGTDVRLASSVEPQQRASNTIVVAEEPDGIARIEEQKALPGGADWFDDLDSLITELESARIVPKPDFESIPSPALDDDIEDVVSETLARIYASQKQYEEAARVYEQLAEQQPEQAPSFLEKAAEMRTR